MPEVQFYLHCFGVSCLIQAGVGCAFLLLIIVVMLWRTMSSAKGEGSLELNTRFTADDREIKILPLVSIKINLESFPVVMV